jgi:hypothetical protein
LKLVCQVVEKVHALCLQQGFAAVLGKPRREEPQVAAIAFQCIARQAVFEPERIAEFIEQAVVRTHQ